MNFVSTNYGMEGLFALRTPRELIEGYTDDMLLEQQSLGIYKGGDVRPSEI